MIHLDYTNMLAAACCDRLDTVDGMVARMTEALKLTSAQVNVVATGGVAPMVVHECRSVTDHQPWLTLLGLELVFTRNT